MSSYHPKGKRRMRAAAHVGPNMTPMVDVVMVILIFFMLGSSFASPDWYLTNNTPAIKGGLNNVKVQKMPATRILIKLTQIGSHTRASIAAFQTEDISGQLLKWLQAKKKAAGKKVQVLISPANDVPYQQVITTYSDCVQAQYTHVAFSYTR
ncbi:MAG: biopolymer transporter ExbD [Phycisphaerae bacterium]|nr:biopolymer transporter ExbD [Phycisphaerae bacterium]